MGISVMLLAYKEEENLKVLFPKLKQELEAIGEEYEFIVVDTREPLDHTKELCEEVGARYFNQEEPGFGGAYRKGIQVADMDKLLALDSDGSHDPAYIANIYRKFMEGYDVVIGSRYVEGGTTSDAKSSQIMSWMLNTAYRLCLGIKAKDISTNFRIYHTEQLKQLTLSCTNYDILEEILLKLKFLVGKKEFRIAESPISFSKRLYGESKRQLLPFILSYIKTLFRLFAMRLQG
ncbi:MAG: glycosyltransferase [Bacteroides sp.]|nr:glycosyltransferase [Bacteroides sp.]MCM1548477.1 glycosyltransferase [Clostridium sp.]